MLPTSRLDSLLDVELGVKQLLSVSSPIRVAVLEYRHRRRRDRRIYPSGRRRLGTGGTSLERGKRQKEPKVEDYQQIDSSEGGSRKNEGQEVRRRTTL